MAGTAFGLPQIASLYDPSVAVDQQALERQMQIAQALRQQSMTPVDTSGRQIGGMGYRVSPWEGVAKVMQGVMANRQDTANDRARMALNLQMAKALGIGQPQTGQTPQGQPSGPQMSTPSNPQFSVPPSQGQQPQQPSGPLGGGNIGTAMQMGLLGQISPEYAAAVSKNYEPTDLARGLRLAGIDENSALGHQLAQDAIAKQNYIAPVSIRPGGGFMDPTTKKITVLPQSSPGFVPVQDQTSPTGFTTIQQPGGPQAVQASAKAQAAGTAGAEPYPTKDIVGNPQPIKSRAAVLGLEPSDTQVPPAVQASRDQTRSQMLAAELRGETNQNSPAAQAIKTEQAAMGGGSYAESPLGTAEAQKSLNDKWEALQSQNREASNTKSYLQNIVTAADKGAITGPGADRREMIQGMLQLAGIKEDVNTNATTQTQLLNKYANQIITRLGQGGLGTDAARSMLSSAYPGQEMNTQAIHEAVGNLNGAQDMTQAKTRFLQDAAAQRNSTAYSRKEIQFDQAADPRLFEYKAITDPAAKQAFAKQLFAQDPTAPQRIDALEKMGAW